MTGRQRREKKRERDGSLRWQPIVSSSGRWFVLLMHFLSGAEAVFSPFRPVSFFEGESLKRAFLVCCPVELKLWRFMPNDSIDHQPDGRQNTVPFRVLLHMFCFVKVCFFVPVFPEGAKTDIAVDTRQHVSNALLFIFTFYFFSP